MRWTQALIPTLREAPQDAEIISHQLLLRGGFIRKLTSGIYTFLPLGLRVLRKIEQMIREEMDRSGALELLMPALQPYELWQQSPRYQAAQQVMFSAQPMGSMRRTSQELLLGPTHEEVITSLVAGEVRSYRQLPKNLYQIQTKFRDEIRPRFGLLRAKEFLMKDAYSFDMDDKNAEQSYHRMYETYRRIFDRCGLKYRIVEADTGVMGGNFSHEFVVPCNVGESEIAYTEDESYAASLEKARSRAKRRSLSGAQLSKLEKFPTPGITTIVTLAKTYGVAAEDQIKTLVYLCDSKFVLFLLRGDHLLNEAKVAALGFSEFRAATEAEIISILGARPGSLGAVGVKTSKIITQIIVDECLKEQGGMTTGANEDGFHWRGVKVERDITVTRWADLRMVTEGELDFVEGKPLKIERGIEVGHIFKLGTKYSEAFKAYYLDETGKTHPCVMGCYGIGITRTLQAIVEQSHDDDGIIWPLSVAPYTALIQLLEGGSRKAIEAAEKAYMDLQTAEVDVILDDRNERPGVKFKDADLLGIPFQIRFGKKFLESGMVEVKNRRNGLSQEVAPDKIVSRLK